MIGNIPSLGLLVFGISLTIACMACVGEQSPVAPSIGVTEEVRSQLEVTRVPTPTPIITQLSTQQSTKSDLALKLADIPHNLPAYDRGDWKHWLDMGKDCQNTRHDVLIDESSTEVIFKDDRECQVAVGAWRDPYTGEVVTDATKLDIDHMIPLKNAHDSGGWAWGRDKKAVFANEISYVDHLIAITASANRSKGARGPEDWKPANKWYWCDYAVDWVQIKADWDLSVTNAEWEALQEMLGTCDTKPFITTIP